MATKKKSKKAKKAKKVKSNARHYCSMDYEKPLPKKWWTEVPAIDERAWEDILCDLTRWIQGFFGKSKEAQRLMYVSDIYRIMAENERLRRENKKLKIKMRKVSK